MSTDRKETKSLKLKLLSLLHMSHHFNVPKYIYSKLKYIPSHTAVLTGVEAFFYCIAGKKSLFKSDVRLMAIQICLLLVC